MPGIGRCIRNHAIPIRSDDFAGIGSRLKSLRSPAGHKELVLIAALYVGKEAGPVSVSILDQPERLVIRAPCIERAGDINVGGAGRPGPKRDAARDRGRAHRGIGPHAGLISRHRPFRFLVVRRTSLLFRNSSICDADMQSVGVIPGCARLAQARNPTASVMYGRPPLGKGFLVFRQRDRGAVMYTASRCGL